jgi:short-subunit dehydrogenase
VTWGSTSFWRASPSSGHGRRASTPDWSTACCSSQPTCSCFGRRTRSETKFAVEGLTEALFGELDPLGIKVTLIEPGLTATSFLANLDHARTIADYDQTVREVLKTIGGLPSTAFNSAERVADAIIAATEATTAPHRIATGSAAVQDIRAALVARIAELDEWTSVSNAVDGTN